MNYSQRFSSKFFTKLLQPIGGVVRDRATTLEVVFELLDQKEEKNFTIIETGCMRPDYTKAGAYSLGDDGSSTYIFDDFVNFYDGQVYSVDIKKENVDYATSNTSDKTKITCSDSVEYLWSLSPDIKADFLYLDSYDLEPSNPVPSQLHHIKELCAAMKNTREGTIVVVDDHLNTPNLISEFQGTLAQGGKARYVEDFMNNIDAELLFDGYQIGWRI